MNKKRLLSSLFLPIFILCCCSLRAAESPPSNNKGYHGSPYSWLSYVNPKAYINWIWKTGEYTHKNLELYKKAKNGLLAIPKNTNIKNVATQLKKLKIENETTTKSIEKCYKNNVEAMTETATKNAEAIKETAIKSVKAMTETSIKSLNKFSKSNMETIKKSLKKTLDAKKATEIYGYKSKINNHEKEVEEYKKSLNGSNYLKNLYGSQRDELQKQLEKQLEIIAKNSKSFWYNHRGKIVLGVGLVGLAVGATVAGIVVYKIMKNRAGKTVFEAKLLVPSKGLLNLHSNMNLSCKNIDKIMLEILEEEKNKLSKENEKIGVLIGSTGTLESKKLPGISNKYKSIQKSLSSYLFIGSEDKNNLFNRFENQIELITKYLPKKNLKTAFKTVIKPVKTTIKTVVKPVKIVFKGIRKIFPKKKKSKNEKPSLPKKFSRKDFLAENPMRTSLWVPHKIIKVVIDEINNYDTVSYHLLDNLKNKVDTLLINGTGTNSSTQYVNIDPKAWKYDVTPAYSLLFDHLKKRKSAKKLTIFGEPFNKKNGCKIIEFESNRYRRVNQKMGKLSKKMVALKKVGTIANGAMSGAIDKAFKQ